MKRTAFPNTLKFCGIFGDGETSGELSPVHEYAQSGAYEANLTLTRCGDTLNVSQSVSVEAVGIGTNEQSLLVEPFAPNITNATSYLKHHFPNNERAELWIYNLNGTLVKAAELTGTGIYTLNAKELQSGIYF